MPRKRRKLDFLVYSSTEQENSDELQRYLLVKMEPNAKPLDWWKRHESEFPKVAYVARSVLYVPATSMPSERIFSTTGLLINKLRNRLASDLVDAIVFLNKNNVHVPSEVDSCDF